MSIKRDMVVGALLLNACSSSAFDLEEMFGKWIVRDVYCGSCARTDKSDIGAEITLHAHRVDNPLAGGSCPGVTGYRLVSEESGTWTIALGKLHSSWLTRDGKAKLVSATCNSIDFMLFAVLADGSLVYISEGEIVFRLGKVM